MQNKTDCFYDRFVNENCLSSIDNISIQRKYWVYSFSIALFCLASATFPTFIGYNFENVFAICMFVFELIMFSFLLYFSVRLIVLDRKYRVFRRRYYSLLFSTGYFSLSLTFAIVANFTAEFVSYPDASFSVNLNPIFYLVIFIPLFITYLVFCYYAFMKCFGKYTKSSCRTTSGN